MQTKIYTRVNTAYLELFWSLFPSIRTEYGKIWSISPYSFQKRKNIDHNNPDYGHFSLSAKYITAVEDARYNIFPSNICSNNFLICFGNYKDVHHMNIWRLSLSVWLFAFLSSSDTFLRLQTPNLPTEKRSLFSEVINLTNIILIAPATNAVSEKSFSTIRPLIKSLERNGKILN